MSKEARKPMLLGSIKNVNFGQYKNYRIADTRHFFSIASRMTEDVELSCHVLARIEGSDHVNEKLVERALFVYSEESVDEFANSPEDALVDVNFVREHAKSPLAHDGKALVLMSRFVNYKLIDAVKRAAQEAEEEGTRVIMESHFSWCHLLPYPLNVYLC